MNTEQPHPYQIYVTVETQYIAVQSKPDEDKFVFAYTITITNSGTLGAKLLSRHWLITDANNEVHEVRGEGVIGEQPTIGPDSSFSYTSGTLLATDVGHMQGSYQMLGEDGRLFDIEIPAFSLAPPHTLH
jgi:ApaG protein